jgi:acyl-homoserine-lactone acylase
MNKNILRSFPWRWMLGFLGLALIALVTYAFRPIQVDSPTLESEGDGYQVRILRDDWGVPHIFGQTDADASFGLAYAHAEDDFLTIQQTILAARGRLASVYGKDAAANDYMVYLLRIWDVVQAGYERDLSLDSRQVIEAYADGINYYAGLHPGEVLSASLFPVSGKDIVAASVHKSPLFFQLDDTLAELFAPERQRKISPGPAGAESLLQENSAGLGKTPRWVSLSELGTAGEQKLMGFDTRYGSNTFSVGPARTPDGSTYLAVNSHQPWQGPTTWYEAHVHSEQGWDMSGATFPATPALIHGHNRNLGWAFTVNQPDLADVYVLEINPENPYQYRFDGEWLDLEVRQAPIEVRLFGRLTWTVKEETLWSLYGPVVRQDHGTYALRYAGYGLVNIDEQLYRMNKAQDFETWQQAMRAGGLPNFNVGYADREGNIYYLYNAMLPLRADGYDWSLYLPGNTSRTLWTERVPFEQLPQVLNPASGFLQNANSSPFRTTLGSENPRRQDYARNFGIETRMTNRSLRLLELFGADESITFDEFIAYKYDWTYSERSAVARFTEILTGTNWPEADGDLRRALEILDSWDLQTDPQSRGATLMVFTLHHLIEAGQSLEASALVETDVPIPALKEAFQQAVATLKENFGRVDVPWEQVNRLQRGEVDLGLGGGPDVLHAIYGSLQEDGRFKAHTGDSYVQLTAWDASDRVRAVSIHQFGSATLDEGSAHYADQSVLFAQRQLKPAWFDEAEIRAHLEREYRPGEEIGR